MLHCIRQSRWLTLTIPADPFAIHQACLRWLRTILHSKPFIITICLPRSTFKIKTPRTNTEQPPQSESTEPCRPNAVSNSDQSTTITCQAVSEVMDLYQQLQHPLLCSCHGQQVLQEQQFVGCPVTGRCLSGVQLTLEDSIVQVSMLLLLFCWLLGRSTTQISGLLSVQYMYTPVVHWLEQVCMTMTRPESDQPNHPQMQTCSMCSSVYLCCRWVQRHFCPCHQSRQQYWTRLLVQRLMTINPPMQTFRSYKGSRQDS